MKQLAVEGSNNSRVRKTILNAKVNFIFYFLTLIANFVARKYFLETLGDNFIGLTGTLLNILGYLNLAELGVSSAISFNLYKPIREGNFDKISKIVSLLGYYYRNIGLMVAGGGVILSGFLFFIFRDSAFQDFGVIYFAYFAFLASALFGYFMNYRQILLVADQKNYVVSAMFQTSNIIKAIVQIFCALYTHNFYLWIAVELVFSFGYSLVLNRKISKVYPWLKCKISVGKSESKSNPEIFKSTKQVFIHKIKDFLLTQSDQLFVFIFVSLKMVAFYGNYVLITSRVMQLFNQILDSVLASVGNLIAENDKSKMMKVFWELMAIRYFIAGFLSFLIFRLIDPFIVLWLGEEYLLGKWVVILLSINLFIFVSRGTVDNFNFAFGHFADVWSAWVELFLNVGITIVGGYYWGIPGILLGKTVSMLVIVVMWKPYYLFNSGLHEPYRCYWSGTIRYYVFLAIAILISNLIIPDKDFSEINSIMHLLGYGIMNLIVFVVIYSCGIMFCCPGGKHIMKRILKNR